MQTNFTPKQLEDSQTALSEKILRTCVHCGFCTATCPTYVTLGDELDSPRGRIYLIKDMLENDRPADEKTVKHIDRCLSCLSCMTTCPSGVHYMHLVDHARAYIEKTYRRPLLDKFIRILLTSLLPYPARFRFVAKLARFGKPFSKSLRKVTALKRFGAMLELAPSKLPEKSYLAKTGVHKTEQPKKGRVALLTGCAQPVLQPSINEATVELLNNLGVEIVLPEGEGCCGALVHHMGKEKEALEAARRNVDAWISEIEGEGLDAIIITASGCGTTIKDYGHMLQNDENYREKAERVSELAKDITEYLVAFQMPKPIFAPGFKLAYHSACSMQHGQKITQQPKNLLRQAGFRVADVAEGHLCCGSAGTYNIMQPEISQNLLVRKVNNLKRTKADIIATGNIGCITQIAKGMSEDGSDMPVVHTVELLNWIYGGKTPDLLKEQGYDAKNLLFPKQVAQ